MPKFRKKPVVIEAFQMTGAARLENSTWPAWLQKAWQMHVKDEGSVWPLHPGTDWPIYIHTLEGGMEVAPDDFIIQGVKGELYPCKPDIFAATYEAA